MSFFCFLWLTENICHWMALESGNGCSRGKCSLTSNSNHLHSRRYCPHLISFCDVHGMAPHNSSLATFPGKTSSKLWSLVYFFSNYNNLYFKITPTLDEHPIKQVRRSCHTKIIRKLQTKYYAVAKVQTERKPCAL
jgi:hypothetical protein